MPDIAYFSVKSRSYLIPTAQYQDKLVSMVPGSGKKFAKQQNDGKLTNLDTPIFRQTIQ